MYEHCNYILTIFFTPRSQPVYATMIRLYAYDCYSLSYVLCCVRHSTVPVCQLFT